MNRFTTAKSCYQAKFDLLRPNIGDAHCEMIQRQEELQRALERVNLLGCVDDEIQIADELASDDESQRAEIVDHDEPENFPEITVVNESSLISRIAQLNSKQKITFNIIKTQINSKSNEPINLCLHGSGGTGKSFVAKIVMDMINLYYNHTCVDSTSPVVVIAAPTGVAAKNIDGVTLHNAFRLPIEKFNIGEYIKLKGFTE